MVNNLSMACRKFTSGVVDAARAQLKGRIAEEEMGWGERWRRRDRRAIAAEAAIAAVAFHRAAIRSSARCLAKLGTE